MSEPGPVGEPTETALIVPVLAAEAAVGALRRALDHSAAWGVPPHVTVLYPFVPPGRLDDGVIERVRTVVARTRAFDCVFARVRWFGEEAVWLAPEPAGPFVGLTEAVWRRFPEHPPYGGAHPDVVPHLTIGSTRAGEAATLRREADEVLPRLPVRARIDRVWLVAGADVPDSWRTIVEFPLT